MRRSRAIASLVAAVLVSVTIAAPVAAGQSVPSVTRLVATARWVTDTDGGRSWYVLWVDAYVANVKPTQNVVCVRATYSDGTVVADQGGFPRGRPLASTSAWLQFGEIPAGATSITVTAQVLRIGARGCCTPVGTLRSIEAPLPERPAPPPAPSEPQLVFDVSFATP